MFIVTNLVAQVDKNKLDGRPVLGSAPFGTVLTVGPATTIVITEVSHAIETEQGTMFVTRKDRRIETILPWSVWMKFVGGHGFNVK